MYVPHAYIFLDFFGLASPRPTEKCVPQVRCFEEVQYIHYYHDTRAGIISPM